jgi:hypothetical protein
MMRRLPILILSVFTTMGAIVPPTVPILPQRSPLNSVMLAWDASESIRVNGYRVYWGPASHTYTNSVDAGADLSVIVPRLLSGTNYYFAATAYNASGLESDYSDEVSCVVPFRTFPPRTNIVTITMRCDLVSHSGTVTRFTNQLSMTNPSVPVQFFKGILHPLEISCATK